MIAHALPWRPIAEADKSKTYDLWTARGNRYAGCSMYNGGWADTDGLDVPNPTHFLEITPPTADAGAAQDKSAVADEMVEVITVHLYRKGYGLMGTLRKDVVAALRAVETKEPELFTSEDDRTWYTDAETKEPTR